MNYLCNWRSTNLVSCSFLLLFFSWVNLQKKISHSILNRFWSTRSQMMDNALLYHLKHFFGFLWKFRNFEQKWVLGFLWNEPILVSCETRFLFLMTFKFYMQVLILAKSIINLNTQFFQNLHLFSDFDNILYESSLFDC